MTIKPMILGLGLLMGLAGCHQTAQRDYSPPGNPPPPPPPRTSGCNAEDASFAIGETATERLGQRAMMASGADTLRVLRPGMAHTMEYNPARLNLEVDENDIVRRVNCN